MKDEIYKLLDTIVIRIETDDYGILFEADSGDSYIIDPVAISICKCLKDGMIINNIWEKLSMEFDMPHGAELEVYNFIGSLKDKGLAYSLYFGGNK